MATVEPSSHHFVIFTVEKQHYALPLNRVSRAVRMVTLTPMPEAAPWIAGVVNVAGLVTPVIDLRRRLGYESKPVDPADRLLILDEKSQAVALIVDQVSEVLEWPITAVEPPPKASTHTQAQARLLTGVIHHAETLIMVLDPGNL